MNDTEQPGPDIDAWIRLRNWAEKSGGESDE